MASTTPAKLSITPLTPDSIPPRDALLAAARELLPGTGAPDGWKKGKTYGAVQALARKVDGASWHARLSVHTPDECTFAEFRAGLGRAERAALEAQYIPVIDAAVKVGAAPAGEIWSMHYVFPPPLQPRAFTVLQALSPEEEDEGEFWVVQLPVDVSGDAAMAAKDHGLQHANVVRGRYASVERIRKTQDGKTEWLMATCSAAGGNIPQFVQEMSIPGQIAHDVPKFLEWVKQRRETKPTPTAAVEEESAPAPVPT